MVCFFATTDGAVPALFLLAMRLHLVLGEAALFFLFLLLLGGAAGETIFRSLLWASGFEPDGLSLTSFPSASVAFLPETFCLGFLDPAAGLLLPLGARFRTRPFGDGAAFPWATPVVGIASTGPRRCTAVLALPPPPAAASVAAALRSKVAFAGLPRPALLPPGQWLPPALPWTATAPLPPTPPLLAPGVRGTKDGIPRGPEDLPENDGWPCGAMRA